ncbi:hypothetical protein CHARACLAT_017208 [Characodon lateralis]|uniref:Agouti signaling protein n=1 Tax=Characodon lateralis TaxID=208331 RepID=A0ABU7D1B1_9TELE|nr:hypothetical protein [Characodon lateralis]
MVKTQNNAREHGGFYISLLHVVLLCHFYSFYPSKSFKYFADNKNYYKTVIQSEHSPASITLPCGCLCHCSLVSSKSVKNRRKKLINNKEISNSPLQCS